MESLAQQSVLILPSSHVSGCVFDRAPISGLRYDGLCFLCCTFPLLSGAQQCDVASRLVTILVLLCTAIDVVSSRFQSLFR